MDPNTDGNHLCFTLDSNSDNVENFNLLVDYLKEHHEIEEVAYSPAFWQNGHFHFQNKGILYQLEFNDILGLEIKVATSLTKEELRKVKKLVKALSAYLSN